MTAICCRSIRAFSMHMGLSAGASPLRQCMHAGLVSAVEMLQPIKDKVPNVSWADLMQMASALSIEDAGGPKIDMRYGRVDCADEELRAADGVLPGALHPPVES